MNNEAIIISVECLALDSGKMRESFFSWPSSARPFASSSRRFYIFYTKL
jgi:hypothetical protein